MLDGLDEVPWESLQHAYGTADDVAGQLRDLVADEEAAREAIEQLFSNILHQGDTYTATPHAVPFLVETFRSPQSGVRVEVGHLLRSIADGSTFFEPSVDVEGVTIATHDAVAAGLDAYLEVLHDPEAPQALRMMAAHVCGGCRRARDRAAAALMEAVRSDSEGPVQSALMVALDDLFLGEVVPEAVVDLFREIALESPHPAARGMAIVSLLHAGRPLADLDAGAVIEAMLEPGVHGRGWGTALIERAGEAELELWVTVVAELLHSPDPERRRFGGELAKSRRIVHGAAAPAVIELFAPLAMAEDDEVREAAIRVLGSFSPRPAVADVFAAALDRYPNDNVALVALARCCDERAVAPLLAAIKTGDPAPQIWFLPFVGPFAPEVLPTLVAQTRSNAEADQFPGVELERLRAIGRFGEVAAQHGAVELCRDLVRRGIERRMEALSTLAAIGPAAKAALDVVQELADSGPPVWRVHAVQTLWSISHDPTRVIGPLTAIIEEGDRVMSVGGLLLEIPEHLTHLLPRLRTLAVGERLNAATRQVVEQVIAAVEAASAPPHA